MIFVKSWCFSPPPLSLYLRELQYLFDRFGYAFQFLTTLFLNGCPNVSEHCYLWRRINAAF